MRRAKAADFARAHAAVKAWNKDYPPGTGVSVKLRDGGTMESTTFSYAFVHLAVARVWADGFEEPVSLKALTPVEERKGI